MKKKPAIADDDEAPQHHAKQRMCLSCESTFTSLWPGERICMTCKRSTSWRTGSAHKRTGVR